jgi:hypothetical protein
VFFFFLFFSHEERYLRVTRHRRFLWISGSRSNEEKTARTKRRRTPVLCAREEWGTMSSDNSYVDRGFARLLTHSSSDLAPAPTSRMWSDADLETRLPGLLRVIDWFAIAVLGLTMDALFVSPDGTSLTHALAVVLGATATVNFLHLAHAYSMHSVSRLPVQLTKLAVTWCGAFLGVMMIGAAVRCVPRRDDDRRRRGACP